MPNIIRIKRRASGNAGAPAALKSAELAHNEVDDTLYVGKGDDGSGNATSVIALAGKGAFADLSLDQFRKMIDVHYYGTLHVSKAAWPHMVEYPSLCVNNTPNRASGCEGRTGITPYMPACPRGSSIIARRR